MNRQQRTLVILLLTLSLGFILLALFAEAIGLDNDPGWGRGRVLLLGLGLALVFLAALATWGKYLEAACDPFFARLQKLAIPPWLRRPPLPAAVVLSVGLMLLAGYSYVWLYTHGRPGHIPITTRYLPMLADAFRDGQLFLNIQPSAELLALDNPYDPRQYTTVEVLHDASLYKDRYYLYWGPAPALLLLLLPETVEVGDAHLALGFGAGLAVVTGSLLLLLWRRFFPARSWWAVLPGLALLFWGAPIPFMFAATSIYEVAILAGQFFIVLGLLLMLSGLSARPRYLWIFLAGISWTLAAGSRVTTTPVFVLLAALLLWGAWKNLGWQRADLLRSAAALAFPLAAGAVALFWYNYARFGSLQETGMCYALSVVDMSRTCPHLFSLRYLPANLYLFLFRPLSLEPDFPFVFFRWIEAGDFPFFIRLADHYYVVDPLVGVLFTLPFSVLFAAVAGMQQIGWRDIPNRYRDYVQSGLLLSMLISFGLLLVFFAPMPRYLADFSILLTLGAMMGFWRSLQTLNTRPTLRFAVILLALCLVLWAAAVGFLTGISGTSRTFYESNPQLFNMLRDWFSAIGLGS